MYRNMASWVSPVLVAGAPGMPTKERRRSSCCDPSFVALPTSARYGARTRCPLGKEPRLPAAVTESIQTSFHVGRILPILQ